MNQTEGKRDTPSARSKEEVLTKNTTNSQSLHTAGRNQRRTTSQQSSRARTPRSSSSTNRHRPRNGHTSHRRKTHKRYGSRTLRSAIPRFFGLEVAFPFDGEPDAAAVCLEGVALGDSVLEVEWTDLGEGNVEREGGFVFDFDGGHGRGLTVLVEVEEKQSGGVEPPHVIAAYVQIRWESGVRVAYCCATPRCVKSGGSV